MNQVVSRPVAVVNDLHLRRGHAFLGALAAKTSGPQALHAKYFSAVRVNDSMPSWAGFKSCLAVLAGARVFRSRGFSVRRKGQSDISQIDFRVGEIKSCEKHPDSDKLLVEQIDIGEEAPRQICSGIGKFFGPEQVVGRKVVIVSNLKARKMAGTASEGMLLCASKRNGEEEELSALDLVEAPEGAAVGERVVVEIADEEHGDAATPNKVGKKKLYEKVAPDLKTNGEGTVCFKDAPFMTSAGPCTAKELPDSTVS